jgi:hypothetical protein
MLRMEKTNEDPDPSRLGKNGKTNEEAFARFRVEVLDFLDMKRTDDKLKRELLGKTQPFSLER